MNFFRAQEQARRGTTLLLVLFGLAVAALIAATNLVIMGVMFWGSEQRREPTSADVGSLFLQQFDWTVFSYAGLIVAMVVLIGTTYKLVQLRAGGGRIAEMLGGRLVEARSSDPLEQRLRNVVEEMALASGVPVPAVYVLDNEMGINAFAAGFKPADAVVGVTRGALSYLNREQLQGVIAHEFSHILNGDMRLNMRLLGVLHGILLIGLIGEFILRSMRHSSGRRDGAGAVVAIGAGLMIVGYGGTFFGKLIKAAVSRQREYLADASAVQYTRNPGAVADALKVIGGAASGSTLIHPSASQMSHAYFAEGVNSFIAFLFATHPPLARRIRAVEPRWNGEFLFPKLTTQAVEREQTPAERAAMEQARKSIAMTAVTAAILDRIGQVGIDNLGYAQSLLQEIPSQLVDISHEPYGARALMFLLVLDRRPTIRDTQLAFLAEKSTPDFYGQVQSLLPLKEKIEASWRLPLIDMSIPALRRLSGPQFEQFSRDLQQLIAADNQVDLFEWSLQTLIQHYVGSAFQQSRALKRGGQERNLNDTRPECEVAVSLLAHAAHTDDEAAQKAFDAAMRTLGWSSINLVPRSQLSLTTFDQAMKKLARIKPLQKPLLLKALVAAVAADEQVVPRELELLRAFAAILDCPVPPIRI